MRATLSCWDRSAGEPCPHSPRHGTAANQGHCRRSAPRAMSPAERFPFILFRRSEALSLHQPVAPLRPMISVSNLSKTYASGFRALKDINLEIRRGEIFALLGPNGAGKTTLIGIICGIVNPSAGTVLVDGHDIIKEYRLTRALIGLVPQELTTDAFESVWATVSFSRGLF